MANSKFKVDLKRGWHIHTVACPLAQGEGYTEVEWIDLATGKVRPSKMPHWEPCEHCILGKPLPEPFENKA